MTLSRGQVHQPAVGQDADLAPVVQLVLFDEFTRLGLAARDTPNRFQIQLVVEMSRIADDRAVLHQLEVLFANDVVVAGDRYEDVADPCRVADRHHPVAVHDRLDRLARIDFRDDDVRAHAGGPRRDAASAPAVPDHDQRAAREQHVRGTNDSVERRLPGSVAVVEHVLRKRVVHRYHRIRKDAVALHGAQANDAGRRLLTSADHLRELIRVLREQRGDEVASVVHRDLRMCCDHRFDVRVVRRVVLALDGVGRDAVVAEGRRRIVLRGERIAGAQRDLRAPGLQREHEVRGLGRDVQACADAHPAQRLFDFETVAYLPEDGHIRGRPRNARAPGFGAAAVFYVALDWTPARSGWGLSGIEKGHLKNS